MAAPEAQNLAQVKGVSLGTYNIPAPPQDWNADQCQSLQRGLLSGVSFTASAAYFQKFLFISILDSTDFLTDPA